MSGPIINSNSLDNGPLFKTHQKVLSALSNIFLLLLSTEYQSLLHTNRIPYKEVEVFEETTKIQKNPCN